MSQKTQLYSKNEKAFLLIHLNLNYGTDLLPFASATGFALDWSFASVLSPAPGKLWQVGSFLLRRFKLEKMMCMCPLHAIVDGSIHPVLLGQPSIPHMT